MLSRKRDFKRLLFSGKKQLTQNFIFFWEKGEGRLGIITSRKVGKAVIRNRIRRVTKEAYRYNQNRFEEIDMVIVAKKNATDINLKHCQKNFENFASGISL
ncbi:MAG: ribonuclease P protein component [Deltaproteobacteria bacterium]|nr:ribonuclease P protein component [Deltaproteobacteria bacterium]